VIAITLVAAFAGLTKNEIDREKRAMARDELAAISTSLDHYYLDNGYYPSTDQGLDALLPPDSIDPGILIPAPPRTRRLRNLRDPWGHPFEYESDGNSYSLKSLGPNGVERDSELSVTSDQRSLVR
jgi:general secretion pathway protein G